MEPILWSDLGKGPLNILPYGEPGCGKTRFALSAGEISNTLFVDVDNGLNTALGVPREWLKKVTPMRFTSIDDIDKIYRMLERNDPGELSRKLSSASRPVVVKEPFETIVFDTWSEINWEIREERRRDIKKSGDGKLDFRPNIEIQDWGMITDLNQLCIVAFKELPINFVCCMHEMFFEDKKGGRTSGTPSISGKFAAEIGKHFDIVGHMSVSITGERVMDTVMKARYQAKSRIPIEKQVVNPTFRSLRDAIPKIPLSDN